MARFLHPSEAAYLCTLDPTMKFPGLGREGLCQVGQCAAPIQAFWMAAHIGTSRCLEESELRMAICHFKFELMRKAAGAWAVMADMPLYIQEGENEEIQVIKANKRPRVQEILQAEQRLGCHGEHLAIGDKVGRLHEDAYVGPITITGPIQLWKKMKRARKEVKNEMVIHYIKEEEGNTITYIPTWTKAGAFVFEIFSDVGIWVSLNDIHDDQGHAWRADDRVWKSTIFLRYHLRVEDEIRAYGSQHRFGLTYLEKRRYGS